MYSEEIIFITETQEKTLRRRIFEELVKRPELDGKDAVKSITFHFSPDQGKVQVEIREIS